MIDIPKSEQYIKSHREETVSIMCKFAITDLLLFWSNNEDLKERQQNVWLPCLSNIKEMSGEAVNITYDLTTPNNEQFILWLKNRLSSLSDKELTASFLAATSLKSVILGLLLSSKIYSVEDTFNAAFLEEIYQNELWGKDEEDVAGREQIKIDLQKIAEYLTDE